ncbi:MAG: hypothetical protein ABR558_03580 [Thioalkalivibrio sp.]
MNIAVSPMDDWVTFRELDQGCGCPKGSAFRAFKQRLDQWREGLDYQVLEAGPQAEPIAQLKGQERLYGNTINAVLLSPQAARVIRANLLEGNGEH